LRHNMSEAVGITKLKPGDVSPLVITVGDPGRAKQIAEMMEVPGVLVASNREFSTYTGAHKGKPVTVISHGVGGGGASMAFEEVIKCGAKIIIRAGTCGSFCSDLREGSLVVVSGAVRRDGVSDLLVHQNFPAVSDYKVVAALEREVSAAGIKHQVGLCLTEGGFYDGPLGNQNQFWASCGVKAVEMEVSVLFVICSLRGVKAGAILNVDNYIFERQDYQPHREVVIQGTKRMCQIVLDTIVTLDP